MIIQEEKKKINLNKIMILIIIRKIKEIKGRKGKEMFYMKLDVHKIII
jgi:hypothetical protein